MWFIDFYTMTCTQRQVFQKKKLAVNPYVCRELGLSWRIQSNKWLLFRCCFFFIYFFTPQYKLYAFNYLQHFLFYLTSHSYSQFRVSMTILWNHLVLIDVIDTLMLRVDWSKSTCLSSSGPPIWVEPRSYTSFGVTFCVINKTCHMILIAVLRLHVFIT